MLGSLCDPRVGTAASLVDDLFLNFEVTTWTSEPHTTGVFFWPCGWNVNAVIDGISLSRSLWSYRDKRKLPTVWQHVSLSSFFCHMNAPSKRYVRALLMQATKAWRQKLQALSHFQQPKTNWISAFGHPQSVTQVSPARKSAEVQLTSIHVAGHRAFAGAFLRIKSGTVWYDRLPGERGKSQMP